MQDFEKLIDAIMDLEGLGTPNSGHLDALRPVIEKEVLHYDIIHALDVEGLINGLTFQGGTSLRLCYRSPRFSEDLDFVGGKDFTSRELLDIRACVMDHIGRRYGLQVDVKNPKQMSQEPTYWGLKTDRWQVSVVTNPGRPDLPRQRIKLEVANVPAHTREINFLAKNYEALPDSFSDIAVPVETKDEILADKMVSFASCQSYIRYRDAWDILWLLQNKAVLNPDLVARKIEDYQSENYEVFLADMIGKVRQIATSKKFYDEMARFVSPEVRARTLDNPNFTSFLGAKVQNELEKLQSALFSSQNEPSPEDQFLI